MTLLERIIEQVYIEFDVKEDEDNSDIDLFIETLSTLKEEDLIEIISVVYFQKVLLDNIMQEGVNFGQFIDTFR